MTSNASTPPIDKIPPEILSKIFVLCLPSSPEPPLLSKAPLLLGTVCSRWRAIALATPALWATLKLRDTSRAANSILTTWLLRAGAVPLDYDLTATSAGGGRHLLLQPLIALHARWRDVSFTFSVDAYASFQSVCGCSFPVLRRLSLCIMSAVTDSHMRSFGEVPPLDLLDAPLLQELKVVPLTSKHLRAPWAQLTRLEIIGETLADDLSLLRQCPALIHLILHNYGRNAPEMPPDPVVLPHLQSIRLASLELLSFLILPALTTWHVNLTVVGFRPHTDGLSALFERWACSLTTLVIAYNTYCDIGMLKRILVSAPSVVELRLDAGLAWSTESTSLGCLALALGWPASVPVLSKLAVFELTLQSAVGAQYTARCLDGCVIFVEILRRRALSRVRLCLPAMSALHTDVAALFCSLRDTPMEVEVVGKNDIDLLTE
ncbi:hypothetical protein MKEN_00464500 [Mycena kentingensis (nom. inval.)]|nr:hypothetical protein MKEN_00464500 [Mycena kentingensis (nom. inval.)]